MTITPVSAFTDNYIWIIIDKENQCFYCVDPGESQPVLAFAASENLLLRAILLTHHHHDHVGGVAELMQKYPDCAVFGPKDNRIPYINHPVVEKDIVVLGRYSFHILFNPGHTSSHISFYEAKYGLLFCGDTLFSGGCGRVFDGTLMQLFESLNMFQKLPPETKIYCAHEYTHKNLQFAQTVEPDNQTLNHYLSQLEQQNEKCSLPSTIKLECQINPFFRLTEPGVQEFAIKHGAKSKSPIEVFRILRQEKDSF